MAKALPSSVYSAFTGENYNMSHVQHSPWFCAKGVLFLSVIEKFFVKGPSILLGETLCFCFTVKLCLGMHPFNIFEEVN